MATREDANEWLASGGYAYGISSGNGYGPGSHIRDFAPASGYTLLVDKAKYDEAIKRAEGAESRIEGLEADFEEVVEDRDSARLRADAATQERRHLAALVESLRDQKRALAERAEKAEARVRELEAQLTTKPFDWANATDEDLLAGAKVGDRVRVECRNWDMTRVEKVWSLNDAWMAGMIPMRGSAGVAQWRVVEIMERAASEKSSEPETLTAAEAEAYLREQGEWARCKDNGKRGDLWAVIGGKLGFIHPDDEAHWAAPHLALSYEFTVAPDEPPPWREVSAEDALREHRLHPDDEWEFNGPHGHHGPWDGKHVETMETYRHRPRRKSS